VYQIDQDQLEGAGAVVAPSIRFAPTGFTPSLTAACRACEGTGRRGAVPVRCSPCSGSGQVEADWVQIMGELVGDPSRNRRLLELVEDRVAAGRRVLVLSDRVEHCKRLAAELGDIAEPLVGALSKKKRADVLARAQAGTLRVVTATSVADEGLDVPGLDCVILATPSKNVAKVQQRVGRVCRPAPGKAQPEVLDLVDDWGPAARMARARRALYAKLGWNPPRLEGRP
jgi:superfamily II DNA/RNA helicase